jgi:hypothetical protein
VKSSIWFRATAALFVFFALSHTIGFLQPPVPDSPTAPVYSAMRQVHAPIMGFMRSYLDFYRGFGLSVTVEFLVLGLIAWQLASLSVRQPRAALPLAVTLLIGSIGTVVVSFVYFFAAPMVVSAITLACAVGGWASVARESRQAAVGRAT